MFPELDEKYFGAWKGDVEGASVLYDRVLIVHNITGGRSRNLDTMVVFAKVVGVM